MSSPTPYNDVKAKLVAAALGVPIAWPNEYFQSPEPPGPWLSVQIESSTMNPVDIGAGVWKEEGTAYIDVNVPAGTGTDAARTLAKAVATVFRGLGPQDVVYLGGSISNGSTGDERGLWWSMTVSVDWRYDDVLA